MGLQGLFGACLCGLGLGSNPNPMTSDTQSAARSPDNNVALYENSDDMMIGGTLSL